MNRKQMLIVIAAYYKSIGRINPPPFKEYTNLELKKTLMLFEIEEKKLCVKC
jgi:hypothetical protein